MFERVNLRALSAGQLDAMQRNERDWVSSVEFDVDSLKRCGGHIVFSNEVDVVKCLATDAAPCWTECHLHLDIQTPADIRLDRLICSEFCISRSRLAPLLEAGHLQILPAEKRPLKRKLQRDMSLVIRSNGLVDEERQLIDAGLRG